MLRARGVGGYEREIDFGLGDRGKLNLGPFSGFLQALECHSVLLKVDALLFFELISHPLDDPLVEVIPT